MSETEIDASPTTEHDSVSKTKTKDNTVDQLRRPKPNVASANNLSATRPMSPDPRIIEDPRLQEQKDSYKWTPARGFDAVLDGDTAFDVEAFDIDGFDAAVSETLPNHTEPPKNVGGDTAFDVDAFNINDLIDPATMDTSYNTGNETIDKTNTDHALKAVEQLFLQDTSDLADGLTNDDIECFAEDALLAEISNDDTAKSHDLAEQSPIDFEGAAFVRFYAAINVTTSPWVFANRKSRNKTKELQFPRGNSRDEPTVFLFKCSLCEYSTPISTLLDYHKKRCKPEEAENNAAIEEESERSKTKRNTTPEEEEEEEEAEKLPSKKAKTNRKAKPKMFVCHLSGCDKAYTGKKELQRHIRAHDGKKCDQPECIDLPIMGAAAWKNHQSNYHSVRAKTFQPSKCLVSGCKHPTVYTKIASFNQHLHNVHGMSNGEANKFRAQHAKE